MSSPSSSSLPVESSSADPSRAGLIVIGAGLGRTGTESLKEALEILLNGRCYHAIEMFTSPQDDVSLWSRLTGPDLDLLFDHRSDHRLYRAGVDYPVCAFVPELMTRYPNALIVLSLRRSADEWAKSSSATIIRVSKLIALLNTITLSRITTLRKLTQLFSLLFERTLGYKTGELNYQRLVEGYNQHRESIRTLVPKERLLEYQVGEGWDPLCKRLNLPIPNIPYPHKNKRENFGAKAIPLLGGMMLRNNRIILIVTAMIVLLAIVWCSY